MAWRISVGNLAQRASRNPEAVSPAVSDTVLPLTKLANGYPDDLASFAWRSDGAYAVDMDLNALIETSARADAPTGWRDLLLALAGTPGLPTDPPDWGTYAARTALRFYWPTMQEVEVLPGENWKLEYGLYRPSGATGSTGTRIRVVDTWSGKGWNGSAWASGGVVDTQSTADAWKDGTSTVTADPNRDARSVYRVIVEPVAATYDSTSYAYCSANGGSGTPVFYPQASLAALIGHNFPTDATVTIGTHSVTLVAVSCSVEFTAEYRQTWRVDITMPSGNQPRPKIGELWIGSPTVLTRGPMDGIQLLDGDEYQYRLEAAQGRVEVLSDQLLPSQRTVLEVKTTSEASYEQWRNLVARASRFGVEPLLLLPPDQFDGVGRILHGRIGPTVAYTLPSAGWRKFKVEFVESPFAGE